MPKTIYDELAKEEEQLETLAAKEEAALKGTKDEETIPAEHEESGSEGAEEGKPEGRDEGESEGAEGGEESGSGEASKAGDGSAEEAGSTEENLTPSAAAFAKMRREKRELAARLAEAEKARIAPVVEQPKVEQPKTEEAKTDAEPNQNDDPIAWMAWKMREQDREIQSMRQWRQQETQKLERSQVVHEAIEEFGAIANEYKKQNPDFDKAMDFAKTRYVESMRMINPGMSDKQINATVQHQLLTVAAQFATQGVNPAEALYDLAIERFGYDPEANKAPVIPKGKPNLRIVESNKKRSATSLGSGGQGGAMSLTKEAAAEMSLGEFSRLTPSQLAELEAMG